MPRTNCAEIRVRAYTGMSVTRSSLGATYANIRKELCEHGYLHKPRLESRIHTYGAATCSGGDAVLLGLEQVCVDEVMVRVVVVRFHTARRVIRTQKDVVELLIRTRMRHLAVAVCRRRTVRVSVPEC